MLYYSSTPDHASERPDGSAQPSFVPYPPSGHFIKPSLASFRGSDLFSRVDGAQKCP